jgi:type VI secretion system protein ImpL
MMSLLKNRLFLAAIGIALLALLIWFVGPYFAFADYKPLEGVVARLVAIIVLVVIYAAIVQWRVLRGARASKQLAADVTKTDDKAARAGAGDAEQLRRRFEEATEALRKSKKKGTASLYELPWYIIIGPPGSGKTTVLVNSGLNFPLAQKFGKEAMRGVGGTRNCDWWFTDEAILLDTAGRYTTQDSNATADATGWAAFLQLLRKHRARQPINGVIVAMSAADLLTQSDAEREKHVVALRERLDELGRNLRIDVPVYFLVTKCDLIAGFAEFFDELGQEARAQVWGITFPIEATESGKAAEHYAREHGLLLDRLQQRVLARMENERDPRRRAGILAFPQEMATLQPLLDDLLRRVFTASGFDKQVMLRGVYFTSGTQEGTPVDRMLAAIASRFGVTSAVAAPMPGRGKAFFIERLLRNVIFNESGLAGVNRRVQLQKFAVQSAAYIACAVVLVLGIVALLVSYSSNASYIDKVDAAAKSLDTVPAPAAGLAVPVDAYLPRLDVLRAITAAAEQYRDGAPILMHMGLYRGKSIGEAARSAYTRSLNGALVPALAAGFEDQLRANVAAPDRLYEYLKGYLMLADDKHRDPDHLRFLAQREWQRQYSSDPAAQQRLGEHFGELLSDDRLTSVTNHQDTVDQARFALTTAKLPVLMYSRLKLGYMGTDKPGLRLDVLAGTGADHVLQRRSGKALSEPVPALYTRTAFREVDSTGKYELIQQFAQDAWVFGGNTFDVTKSGALAYQVLDVYEQDYLRYWDELAKDVQLKLPADSAALTEVLGIVSSPASPLKGFLTVVAQNTNLLAPDTSVAGKAAAEADKVIAARTAQLTKLFGAGAPAGAKPGTRVTEYFAPIQRLVDGPPGQAPIDSLLATLAGTYRQLQATGSGLGATSALDAVKSAGQADALKSLQTVAKQLPQPIGEMIAAVGTRSESLVMNEARGDLERRYAQQVLRECKELVDGRYPFTHGSTTDVPLADFARVFGPNGVFDSFFRENLNALVDTSRSPWIWRDGAAQIGGSAAMLRQFQLVGRIRDIFFRPGSQMPEARFNLAPDDLDASATRFNLDVDGQPFEYRHGPLQSRTFTWPGGGIGQASFAFEDRSGPVPGISKQGPWALFRVLDEQQVERQSDTRYRVTFTAGGKTMQVIIEATSSRNPFGRNELGSFRCTM